MTADVAVSSHTPTAIGRRHQLPLFLVHFAQGRLTDEQMPTSLLDYLHASVRRR